MLVEVLYWVLLLLSNHVVDCKSSEQHKVVRRWASHEGELLHAPHTRFVEVYALYDQSYLDQFRGYTKPAKDYIIQVFNIANAAFRPLGIVLVLVGIESSSRSVRVSSDLKTYLENLKKYKRDFSGKQHDSIMLFTNEEFNTREVGYAYTGAICDKETAVAVVKASSSDSAELSAQTVAHELGHNLGMGHDTDGCVCQEDHCLMKEATSLSHNSKQVEMTLGWSNCSKGYLAQYLDDGLKSACLKNVPDKVISNSIRDYVSCGNGISEHGEQCDCGPERYCNNPCCNATTCMLNDHAHCASGVCCDIATCRPKTIGTVCRATKNICDLPEYCSGHSETCAQDVHKADGLHCHGEDRCHGGQCGAYNRQEWCQRLWGPTSKAAKDHCYRNRDECGALQCLNDGRGEKPNGFYESRGTSDCTYITSRHLPDWKAPDGAHCVQGKMCISSRCRTIPNITCPQSCSGNGVCNSKGHCHCDEGYGPPDCAQSGLGGSVDSGPIIDSTTLDIEVGLWVITALIIIFSIIGLICCLGTRFKKWWAIDGRVYVSSRSHCCASCIDFICYSLIIKMAACFDKCDPPNKEDIKKEKIDNPDGAKTHRKMTICQTNIEVNTPAPDLKSYGCANERLFTEVVTITPKGSPTTSRKIYMPADSPIIAHKEKNSPETSPLPKRKHKPPLLKIQSKDSGCSVDLQTPSTASTTASNFGSMGSLISIFKKFSSTKTPEEVEIRSNGERAFETRHSVEVMTSTPKKPVPLSRIVIERSHHYAKESPGTSVQDSPFTGGKLDYKRTISYDANRDMIVKPMTTPPRPPPAGLKPNKSADNLNKMNTNTNKMPFTKPKMTKPNTFDESFGRANMKRNKTNPIEKGTTKPNMTKPNTFDESFGRANLKRNKTNPLEKGTTNQDKTIPGVKGGNVKDMLRRMEQNNM